MAPRDEFLDYAEESMAVGGYTNDEVRVALIVLEVLAVDWPEVDHKRVLGVVGDLLGGEFLPEACEPSEDEGEWEPILLGDGTRPGHAIRVKFDAYKGSSADAHNGRLGVFAGARNGYVYVKYNDETRDVHPIAHVPNKVEKAVPQ